MPERVHFILNDRTVQENVDPGLLVLDLLRDRLRLTGTKEGCREGDCGACVVLVGELHEGAVSYRPVTSCLMPVGELHGRHLVSIEGLRLDRLTPVQEAIVEEGASQCGFCTPGIVLSLTCDLMERSQPPDAVSVKTKLGGHLCRCTGYRSLKAVVRPLQGQAVGIPAMVAAGELPDWFLGIAARLASMKDAEASNGRAGALPAVGDAALRALAIPVAGGTDLYVQRGDLLAASPDVLVLGNRPELRGIHATSDKLVVGPATTFEEMAESAEVRRVIPGIRGYMDDIASVQIRHRATVGGNLVNASPIGDVTILLLAFDTTLQLAAPDGGTRAVPLREFYLGYKDLDLEAGELVTAVEVRWPESGTLVSWEKVAKRRSLDIASVNSTLVVREEQGSIADAMLTMGGVAPVPLRLEKTSGWLRGRPISTDTVQGAANHAQHELVPISDIRGSATYKRLLVRQLIWAHFATLFPDRITVEALYGVH